jgi:hypothetical protein
MFLLGLSAHPADKPWPFAQNHNFTLVPKSSKEKRYDKNLLFPSELNSQAAKPLAGFRKHIDMCFPYRIDFFPSTWEGVGNDEGYPRAFPYPLYAKTISCNTGAIIVHANPKWGNGWGLGQQNFGTLRSFKGETVGEE